MAAAAAVVPPALGAGQQREQLLPHGGGTGVGVAMKVEGHNAVVALTKTGLRCATPWPEATQRGYLLP